jgi:elongation factor Ts
LNEGKPANIVEKMITGRIEKSLKEVCLEDQIYVKDEAGKQNVAAYLKTIGSGVSVKRFVRFATGEGIEKKVENFADEVNKAMQ